MENSDCMCSKGVLHSVATDDIKAGQSVMTVKEGVGSERRWITQVAPFQIHEKVEEDDKESDNRSASMAYQAQDR